MKKFVFFLAFACILTILPAMPSFSQENKIGSDPSAAHRYASEEDWIEVMFIQESRVRVRNGELVDLTGNALEGLQEVLGVLAWHTWLRFTDLPETLIDGWETNGERNTGQDLYNLNNIYRLRIPKGHDIWAFSADLEALPGIYLARPVPKPMPLPGAPPGSFQNLQTYLNPITTGIEALWSWTQTGGAGTGVTICDLEYNWNYNHADVTKAVGSQINPNPLTDPAFPAITNINHGTNVIGELVADNNGWGTTGICYNAGLKTCGTVFAAGGGWNVPQAIAYAIASLSAGDIILLEQQWDYTGSGGYIPIEWWMDYSPANQSNNGVYAAIVTAVANGIHVVEAGGNGNYNTQTLTWQTTSSGAIIVGAGGTVNTLTNLKRIIPGTWGSSYGPRYDMQGWGETVVTTGGTYSGAGDLYSAEGANYYYSQSFAGTSSASPMVAGALACVEGYHYANISSVPLTPAFLRNHMVTWGTAQVTPPAGNIGPRPDIKKSIQNLPTVTYDFGDAPEPMYPTLQTSNGAQHTITGLRMGVLIDAEANGQPGPNANGDDINPPQLDDEDGVVFTSSLTPGTNATVQVTVSAPGILNAWIDFDKMGWNGTTDFVFQNYPLTTPGTHLLTFAVPAGAMPGWTYSRFRFSTVGGLLWYGQAPDGEVEDHMAWIEENTQFDFGDAPDPTYPTLLASGGARHVNTGLKLGYLIDTESNGQPQLQATGDDANPPGSDDEDGVTWYCNFVRGQTATLQVTASGAGFLTAWFDFNIDGDWVDPGEHALVDIPLTAGTTDVFVNVPSVAVPGYTFARFRFSTTQGLNYTGLASDGEVEDHQIYIDEPSAMDYGDAPDPTYPTLAISNGARHFNDILTVLYLGNQVDYEMDGIPNVAATGDDLNNPIDDEDGISWNTQLIPGQTATIAVTFTGSNGVFQGWIDFNKDGDWMDSGEQIFTDMVFAGSPVTLNFPVPGGASPGSTYARFRFSTVQGLKPYGCVPNGEVEDYQVTIQQPAAYDLGDAPDPTYETLLASAGAQHMITGLFMGNLIDSEPDGQPDPLAMGDDNFGPTGDDEDGVTWNCNFTPGHTNTVQVTVNGTGFLNAWFDFNADGDWMDPGEQAVTNVGLTAGTTDVFVAVPLSAIVGPTFARFRFASMTGLNYKGTATDGEVEDYNIMIQPAMLMDYGDAPDPSYPTLAASNGARHDNDPQWPLYLGNLIDWEFDGQPNILASGDDINNLADEDGIQVISLLQPGFTAFINVTASMAGGFLQGWIDFNSDGDWYDSGEQIFTNVPLAMGLQVLTFNVPAGAVTGNTFARYRLSTQQNLMPYGCAPDGEVEDYQVMIGAPGVLDLGDAPDPTYPTLIASNGAQHTIDWITFLGATVDSEADGQPDPLALGDDNSTPGTDDEDGVVFNWPLLPGSPVLITVTASVPGLFNGWVDFNLDGTWAQANEQVFTDFFLNAGQNQLHFFVPAGATPGGSFARFRFSTQPALSYTGPATDGEVEDYAVTIENNPELKWQQLYDTLRPGLHAHDYFNAFGIHEWITRADDWLCSGGRVTDIHWWGNYELNAARQERRGGGIHHFHLSIHADNPTGSCLPVDPELWGMDVPFTSLTELFTGDTNFEGSKIYRYDFVLPVPFQQLAGTRYWLDITAFSNNPNNPPIWRWQEAVRSNPPILCGATEKISPVPATWSTTFFPLTNLFTDLAFTITNLPDKTLNLKFLLEGLYKGSTSMVKVQNTSGNQFGGDTTDLVRLELHDATSYSTTLFAKDSISVDTNGFAACSGIPYTLSGNYYITVKHRNSVETVSANPVSFSGTLINYDFCIAASRAYGGNQITYGTDNAFYTGDVNQDGFVDTGDMSLVDNDAANFVTGYVDTDLTGDGFVDTADMTFIDNNNANFIGSMTPP